MADTISLSRRSQRTATLRRRATTASIGLLLGAFALVGATTALPSGGPAGATATTAAPTASATTARRQVATAVPAPQRVRTRQS